ncbi:hypothetical protein SynPROSU1_02030 [Synechococcus sp. PROS-U-1]|nr:hypothetical protein SynPROSU1_02030 [Synechococcus sp. PROS-U-1]
MVPDSWIVKRLDSTLELQFTNGSWREEHRTARKYLYEQQKRH